MTIWIRARYFEFLGKILIQHGNIFIFYSILCHYNFPFQNIHIHRTDGKRIL